MSRITVKLCLAIGAAIVFATATEAAAQTGQTLPRFNIIRPPYLPRTQLQSAPMYYSTIRPQTLSKSPLSVVPLQRQYLTVPNLPNTQWLNTPTLMPGAPLEPSLANPSSPHYQESGRPAYEGRLATGTTGATSKSRRQPLGW